ncbi:MAG: hypothetical protein CMB67_03200 [Euryarchaeota archaeon]|nr:hypothetical protein [Euryarchaeota archaeon]
MVDASVICWGPLLLFAAFWVAIGIAWGVGYPLMFLYGAIFSGRALRKNMTRIVEREKSSIEHFGKDPLSNLRGLDSIQGVKSSGLVYSSVVYGPSHWHLLMAWFNNLFGGSIGILHEVIAVARAEATQRLRERAQEEGWEDILNVRIDTAEMTPASAQKGPRAVEIFAYGTGVRYS